MTIDTPIADEDGVIEDQPQLPGEWPEFPPPPPAICEIQTIRGARPVPSVELGFSGKKLLVATSPEDVHMAQQVGMGDTLWLHVEAEVGKAGLAATKVGIIGQVSLQVVQAIRADEAGVLQVYDELERTREALHRLRSDARLLLATVDVAIVPKLPEPHPDDDSPAARGRRNLTLHSAYVRNAIKATEWVPHQKDEDD